MTRLLIATVVVTLSATVPAAHAAPGDGIAQSCVAAAEARARTQTQLPPDYVHRAALCACLEQRVQSDAAIGDAEKAKLAELFALMVSDRPKAEKMRMELPETVLQRMQVHAPSCYREVVTDKKPG